MTAEELAGIVRATRSTTGAAVWRSPVLSPMPWQHELGGICDRLVDSSFAGTGLRFTLSAPPRHGKTEWTSRAMPIRAYLTAWMRGLTRPDAEDPTFSVMYVTSTGDRANQVSDQIRAAVKRIHRETRDDQWAPGPLWTRNEFQTSGGLRWTATGWRTATGGIGANLLVMDDMIGSAKTYQSGADMAALRRAVESDLLSRLMSGGAALQMETRRGTKDTTAWLTEQFPGQWEPHVWRCYEPDRGYLWPDEYGERWRETMPHLTDSSPVWRSLYQQEPIPEGGTLIDPAWLQATYSEPPHIAAKLADRVLLGVDLAATGKGDPAAVVAIGCRGAYRDVLWAGKRRVAYPEQRQWVKEASAEWGASGVHIERAAGGDALVADLLGIVAGVQGHAPRGGKALRASPFLELMAAGQFRLPAQIQPWMREYREDMTSVTGIGDEEDHYLDATVWALVGASAARRPSHSAWSRALRR